MNMAIDEHPNLRHFVKEDKWRSKTVKVAETDFSSKKLIQYLAEKKMNIGTGYGQYKDSQVRMANFPTHSKEQVEMLVDTIAKFKP
jgi:phosphoserine aminotransferase